MLEAIRTCQDGMVDEVQANIVAELIKRGTFGGFNQDRMQSLFEGIWNKVEGAMKNPQKSAGQL